MKLFHLSDLHLGKRLNEFSLIEDQAYILHEITDIIREEKPDAVLIAGDVYDRTVPSEDAMKLWDDFLIRMAELKMPVFAISGNHDSAVRFSDHGALVGATGIRLSRVYDGTAESYLLSDGDVNVRIHLLPFLKPAVVKALFPEEEINDYTDACRVAISRMALDPKEVNLLIAHQFVTGATTCDSEEIVVGGLDNVDASVFDGFDYVALGHLHGKQKIGRDTVRYCGTPLKYSFSEKDHQKSITVVTIEGKGQIRIDEIPLTPLHDLREIKGTYEALTAKENYENTRTDDYIHAVLTDENDVVDAAAKLRVVYPNLMKLTYDNKRTREQREVTEIEELEAKSPIDLFEEFYEKQNNAAMSEEQKAFAVSCIASVWGS